MNKPYCLAKNFDFDPQKCTSCVYFDMCSLVQNTKRNFTASKPRCHLGSPVSSALFLLLDNLAILSVLLCLLFPGGIHSIYRPTRQHHVLLDQSSNMNFASSRISRRKDIWIYLKQRRRFSPVFIIIVMVIFYRLWVIPFIFSRMFRIISGSDEDSLDIIAEV